MSKTSNTNGAVAAALAQLADAMGDKGARIDWNHQDPDISYGGKRISLPDDPGKMGLREAAKLLNRKADSEETELVAIEQIDAYPLDGAVAFVKAMKELYGWASPIPTMTFFGPMPPKLLTVDIGPSDEPNNQIQVPWGEFTVPGIENPISIGASNTAFGPIFVATGTVKKREEGILKELANKAREILRDASIYKGKAIRLRVEENGKLNPDTPPTFISTRYIQLDELILNPDEHFQIEASLWSPIKNTAKCRQYGIPLKRGVLLEGPFGGGKTMTANNTAKIAVDNKWTFILLDDVRALKDALLFAKRYAPAVVFAEDVDRIAAIRDQRGNDLLNTIDGILSKNSEVITVLTTNYVEKLERAMLRPGRLDAVISITPPQTEAVQRLVKLYARNLLAEGEDLTEVGDTLKGNLPATIREVVERSKLGMINRDETTINARDLLTAAQGMKRHLELLNVQPVVISPGDALAVALKNVVGGQSLVAADGTTDLKAQLQSLAEELRINVMGNLVAVREQGQMAQRGSQSLGKLLEEIKTGNKKIIEQLAVIK